MLITLRNDEAKKSFEREAQKQVEQERRVRLWKEIIELVNKLWSEQPPGKIHFKGQTYEFVQRNGDAGSHIVRDKNGDIHLLSKYDVIMAVYGDFDPQEILRRVREDYTAFFGEAGLPSAPSENKS